MYAIICKSTSRVDILVELPDLNLLLIQIIYQQTFVLLYNLNAHLMAFLCSGMLSVVTAIYFDILAW